MNPRALVAVTSLLLLAACSGGGGSSPSTVVPVTPATSSPGGTVSSAALTLSFAVDTPSSAARRPLFVSPNATSIVVTINSVNGNTTLPAGVPRTTTVALSTAAGGNCTISGGLETCTIGIPAPPGVVNYTFSIFDASNNLLASNTVTFTITSGQGNVGNVVLDGVVKTVPMTVPTLAAGTPQNNPCTVVPFTAKDASGATITGTAPFLFPFQVTDNDNSGHTYLTLNTTGPGVPGTLVVTVSSNNDVVRVCYDGTAISSFSLTVSGNGATGGGGGTVLQPIVITGTTNDDAAHGGLNTDPNFNQPTLTFPGPGAATQNYTASEGGYGGTFTSTLDPATCGSGAGAIATQTTTDHLTWTVTPKNQGLCKVTVTDTLGQSKVLWFSVQAAKPIVFSGPTTDPVAADPSFNQPTLTFQTPTSATQTYTVSEAGYAGTFTSTPDVPTCGTGGGAIATISTTDNFTWTVTPHNAGFCKITVTDTIGQSKVLWIQVKNPQPIVITGTTTDDAAHGGLNTDPNFNAPTIFFAQVGGATQNFVVSESLYAGTFTAALDPASCGSGASAVASLATADHLTWTVTSLNPGICKVTVSDTNAQSKIIWISVTTGSIKLI